MTVEAVKSARRAPLREAMLGSLYFFLVLFAYYMLKPLRDSFFLSEFGPKLKPVFNIITMLVLFFVAMSYSWVVKRVHGLRFIRAFYAFLILNLGAFFIAFKFSSAIPGAIFYPWLSTANIFLTMIFWTQINSSFTGKRDKLFYVLIGLGGGMGSAFGGKVTSLLVPVVGSVNMILASVLVFSLAFGCAIYIARRMGRDELFFISPEERHKANFKGLLKEEYAVCILALVVVGTFVQTIFDFQLSAMVSANIGRDKEALSVFYGSLYFRQNTFSFLAQLIVGPLVLMSIGPARGLYIFLALIFGSAFALFLDNSLPVMEWVMIVFAGSGYSFVQVFREQLYIPASHAVKVSFKGFIDTFGFRVGDTVAALTTLILVGVLGMDIVRLEFLVVLAGLVATYYLYQANRIYRGFGESTRNPGVVEPETILQARAVPKEVQA